MVKRIEVAFKKEFENISAFNLKEELKNELNCTIENITIAKVYYFEKELEPDLANTIAQEILVDPLTEFYSLDKPIINDFDIALEIRFKAGVKDNLGDATLLAIKDVINNFDSKVRSGKIIFIKGINLEKLEKFALKNLYNPLIEQAEIFNSSNKESFYNQSKDLFIKEDSSKSVEIIELKNDEKYLLDLSKRRLLALNLQEMKAILNYFSKPSVIKKRLKMGLSIHPTDVELECIAQTWSEHCKHKIFNATIFYKEIDEERKKSKKIKINSLFKTFIVSTTNSLKKPYVLSAFFDNAGVIKLNKNWALAVKCETHNAPSALDPYGGALTGILGVNRDVLGTGLGAKPIFNTDVFCFALFDYNKKLPPNVIHPKRILIGVQKGVEHGGNASGIPTINGSIVFDNRYLGRPLVYCGTGGIMPIKLKNKLYCTKKYIKPKDRIFMVGGRIGKDGIHGATFSSQEINKDSPTSAVQIGDPFTQKIVIDFLIESRDLGLHSGLTDNGAGGLSSSVGELAKLTNGATIHLERCPLKYSGLTPWEIFLSESQERMTVAVPPQNAGEFVALAKKHNVEVSDIGEFNDSGYLKVFYYNHVVLFLDLKFLHEGLPKMKLFATFKLKSAKSKSITNSSVNNSNSNLKSSYLNYEDYTEVLLKLLSSYNICSKEEIIRRYDHEVLGMSALKPLCGTSCSGPSDAAIITPFYDEKLGVIVANGICPKFSDFDCYLMAQNAVDEAVRNYVSVGGDLNHWAILDNFCWPDPIKSEKNLDGEEKLGQLIRANMGLAKIAKAYSLPIISGKDSMKNDYVFENIKISIPPTLLITIVGTMPDVSKAVSSDFKNEGDLIYLLGRTYNELGGSEFSSLFGIFNNDLNYPQVRIEQNLDLYKKLSKSINLQLINSCHDCSDGGLLIALAECAIGSTKGANIDLTNALKMQNLSLEELLFSESAGRFVVSIDKSKKNEFEKIFKNSFFVQLGEVNNTNEFLVFNSSKKIISANVFDLLEKFKNTLKW
jgi:phosphoribosylformylglycinamidine synthase